MKFGGLFLATRRDLGVGAIAVALGALAGSTPAGAGSDTYLYVLNMNPAPDNDPKAYFGSVSVVRASPDGRQNQLVKSIDVGQLPIQATASVDGSRVWVTNGLDNTVSEIRTDTNRVVSTFPVGAFPTGLVTSLDGRKLYVLNFSDNNVSVIDADSHRLIRNIPVGASPNLAALSPDGDRLYVTNFGSNDVSVIDTRSNTVAKTIPVGNGPDGVAVSPDGAYVYVTNINDNTVSIIRCFTNHVVKTLPSGGTSPNNVGFVLGGAFAYVTNGGADDAPDNKIGVISSATQKPAGVFSVGYGPADVRSNTSGDIAYVPNFADDTVSVVNNIRRQVVSAFAVGVFPVSIAIVKK